MFKPVHVVCAMILPLLFASFALAQGDWTGKTVFPKSNTVKIGHAGPDGKPVYLAELTFADYRVIEEKGGWLRVRQHDVEGWFEKKDAVVLDEAVAFFTGQINANRNNAGAYSLRARALQIKGEFDKAITDCSEAVRLAPAEARYWNNRGNCWLSKKDFDKAIVDFNEAIRLKATDALYFTNRSEAWLAKQEFDKAIKDCDEAIRLNPRFVDAWFNRAFAWVEKKDLDKGIKEYDEVIRLEPRNFSAYYNKACCYSLQKQVDRAIESLQQAFEFGYRDVGHMAQDSDLEFLRSDPRYKELLQKYSK